MGLPPSPRNLLTGIGEVALVLALLIGAGVFLDARLGLPRFLGRPWTLLGLGPAALGLGLETWGTYALWRYGGGTPNPIDPPRRLVTQGPYRFSRNPLYLARLLTLFGGSLLLSSPGILLLTLILLLGLQFLLLPREEKRLEARYERAYVEYQGRVSRWITFPFLPHEREDDRRLRG